MKANLLKILLLLLSIMQILNAEQSNVLNQKDRINLTKEELNWIKGNPSITFAVSADYIPHSFVDTDGIVKGIQIDYIDLIAQKTGLQIFKEPALWPNTLESAMAHKVDGIADLAKRKEREKALNFTEVYVKAPFALITTDDQSDIQDLKSYCGKKVAVTLKTSAAKFLQKEYPCIELVNAVTDNMHEKLITKEVDALFERYEVFLFNNKKALFSGLKVIYYKFIPPSGFSRLGIRNDEPTLLSILNKAIDSITYEEQNEIITKWIGSSFPKATFEEKKIQLSSKESAYLSSKQEITMCVHSDTLPFESIDESGEYVGVGADIMNTISKHLNQKFTVVPISTTLDTLEDFNSRSCDIIPMAVSTPSRQKHMNFTQTYMRDSIVVVTKEEMFFIEDSRGLQNRRVGVVKGTPFVELLKARTLTIEIVEVDSIIDGLKQVQNGELFGYVDALSPVAHTIKEKGIFDLKIAGKLEFDAQYRVASRADEPLLDSIMNKALSSINEEEIKEIVNRWISINIEQSFDYRKIIYLTIFFLTIVFVILYKNRSINKINKELEISHKEVARKNELLKESNNTLTSLLEERETLLKEIQHRVKNNFHSIIGMLYLGKSNSKTPAREYDDAINRITTMAQIHEELYSSSNINHVDTEQYLLSIIKKVLLIFSDVNLKTDIEKHQIDLDAATALGTIINELITNSFKHNESDKKLTISITFQKQNNKYSFIYCDDGKGFDSSSVQKGLGLSLINELTEKLQDAKSHYEGKANGVFFQLNFTPNR